MGRLMVKMITALALGLLAAPAATDAEQPTKIHRIGNLTPGPVSVRLHLYEAFRKGMHELGYMEGQHYVIELRSAEGQVERLPGLAAELVRLNTDVIIAATTPAIRAAKQATSRIPIVMISAEDPIEDGFVASLARPGGNITGLTKISSDLAAKRLDLLREIVPGVSRVAVLEAIPAEPHNVLIFRAMQVAARVLGIQLLRLEVRGPNDFESAFRAATTGRAGALVVLDDQLTYSHPARLVELAAQYRLPALYGWREFAAAGGLLVCGANLAHQWRHAATYVDKILKGAKPADLPVQQPTQFDLIVNLETAKALGLTIPPSVLIRVERARSW